MRKTEDEYEVQGNYGYGHGFECVTAETSFKEARERLKEYRENEPGFPFRIVKKRVKKPVVEKPSVCFKVEMLQYYEHHIQWLPEADNASYDSMFEARKRAESIKAHNKIECRIIKETREAVS